MIPSAQDLRNTAQIAIRDLAATEQGRAALAAVAEMHAATAAFSFTQAENLRTLCMIETGQHIRGYLTEALGRYRNPDEAAMPVVLEALERALDDMARISKQEVLSPHIRDQLNESCQIAEEAIKRATRKISSEPAPGDAPDLPSSQPTSALKR